MDNDILKNISNKFEVYDKNVDEKYYLGYDLKRWEILKGSKAIEWTSTEGHTYTCIEKDQ